MDGLSISVAKNSSIYGSDEMKNVTAVYEKRGKYYVGYIKELPGVNTQGRTLQETKKNIKEALMLIRKTEKQLKDECIKPIKTFTQRIAIRASK